MKKLAIIASLMLTLIFLNASVMGQSTTVKSSKDQSSCCKMGPKGNGGCTNMKDGKTGTNGNGCCVNMKDCKSGSCANFVDKNKDGVCDNCKSGKGNCASNCTGKGKMKNCQNNTADPEKKTN